MVAASKMQGLKHQPRWVALTGHLAERIAAARVPQSHPPPAHGRAAFSGAGPVAQVGCDRCGVQAGRRGQWPRHQWAAPGWKLRSESVFWGPPEARCPTPRPPPPAGARGGAPPRAAPRRGPGGHRDRGVHRGGRGRVAFGGRAGSVHALGPARPHPILAGPRSWTCPSRWASSLPAAMTAAPTSSRTTRPWATPTPVSRWVGGAGASSCGGCERSRALVSGARGWLAAERVAHQPPGPPHPHAAQNHTHVRSTPLNTQTHNARTRTPLHPCQLPPCPLSPGTRWCRSVPPSALTSGTVSGHGRAVRACLCRHVAVLLAPSQLQRSTAQTAQIAPPTPKLPFAPVQSAKLRPDHLRHPHPQRQRVPEDQEELWGHVGAGGAGRRGGGRAATALQRADWRAGPSMITTGPLVL